VSRFAGARRARWIALALTGGLWLVLLAVGLETWARWQARQEERLAREIENRLYAESEWTARDQAVAREVLGAWPDTDADLRAWRDLLNLPPADSRWKKRADTFGEAFLFLDAAGRVADRILPDPAGSSLPAGWLERFTPGVVITDILPADWADDAAAASRSAAAGHQIREYPVPIQENSPPEVLQFVWMPAPPEVAFSILCVIRPSIWKELWIAFRPNVHHQDIMDFQSNSLGWRDGEVLLPRPPDVFRVVCVGGSTTAEGPHNALTYPNLLERRLRGAFPKIDVVNAGIFAILSFGEARRAPDYLALDPSLILHYNFVNDVPYVLDRAESAESFLSPRRLLRRLARHSIWVRRNLDLWVLPAETDLITGLQDTFANMDVLRREAGRRGVPVVFCSFARPGWENLPDSEKAFFNRRILNMIWGPRLTMRAYCRLVDLYNRELRRRCVEWDAPFLDIAPLLAGGAERFTDICHMRVWAMEDKARVIADRLAPIIAGSANGAPGPQPASLL